MCDEWWNSWTPRETEALLAAPDVSTWIGHRDHAILLLGLRTGLPLSEPVNLRCRDITFGTGGISDVRASAVSCVARRSAAIVPTLQARCKERAGCPGDARFPSIRGDQLSCGALERIVRKHAEAAMAKCPSFKGKRVSPGVQPHSVAMEPCKYRASKANVTVLRNSQRSDEEGATPTRSSRA
jgi:integrase/recombinase XerD